jgi:hypothetical protein
MHVPRTARGGTKRLLGAVGVVLGGASTLIGILGLALGWGSSTAPAARASSHLTAEAPATFFTTFLAALKNGDHTYLYSRLDAAVIGRYGSAQCQTWVTHLHPLEAYQLLTVSRPMTFAYTTDGLTSSVPNVYFFTARGPTSGIQTFHFARVSGRFHFFTDCGTPTGRS